MVNILAWLLPLVLYGVLGTVVVLVGVLCGVAIWWLRQASSLLPWLSLGIAPCFLMYAVYLSLKPTWVGVLVLAGVVFFSVELVMETCPSRQDVRRSRAARLGSPTVPAEEETRPREGTRREEDVHRASGAVGYHAPLIPSPSRRQGTGSDMAREQASGLSLPLPALCVAGPSGKLDPAGIATDLGIRLYEQPVPRLGTGHLFPPPLPRPPQPCKLWRVLRARRRLLRHEPRPLPREQHRLRRTSPSLCLPSLVLAGGNSGLFFSVRRSGAL